MEVSSAARLPIPRPEVLQRWRFPPVVGKATCVLASVPSLLIHPASGDATFPPKSRESSLPEARRRYREDCGSRAGQPDFSGGIRAVLAIGTTALSASFDGPEGKILVKLDHRKQRQATERISQGIRLVLPDNRGYSGDPLFWEESEVCRYFGPAFL